MRIGKRRVRVPVLVTLGVRADGDRVILDVRLVGDESTAAWRDVVIDSPIGLVACLPMGMAQVSSVVITAETGQTLHKGEELGYFQFGGSDFVMVFERASNVQLVSQPHVHCNQGSWIGRASPYAMT